MHGRGGQAADRRAGEGPGGAGARKRHGRHYTPPRLAEFLAERTIARLRVRDEMTVLDPACGDGELLLAVAGVAARRFPGVSWRLVGRDSDADAVRSGRARSAGFAVRRDQQFAVPVDGDIALGAGVPGDPAPALSAGSIRFEWEVADFLGAAADEAAASDDVRFDAVITNPPYVRTQQLGGATAQLLSRKFGLSGRIDLTHPFVASVPLLLRPGGVLGLLCANRFLSTKAGANLRTVLSQELSPVELYDLGDTRLFDAAVLPAVTIAVRGPVAPPCRFTAAYETDRGSTSTAGLFEALTTARDCVVEHEDRRIAIETGTLCTDAYRWNRTGRQDPITAESGPPARRGRGAPAAFDASVPWRMSRPGTDEWLRRIGEGTWRTFGEVARIRVGIKTTADRVFISDRWDEQPVRPEAELLRDLLTHHDVAPWRIDRAHDTKVLYPYDVAQSRRTPVQLSEYPATRAYLAQHREVLSARDYLTGSGREWFEIWVPQRPNLWGPPKVVFPDISVAPRFALDRSGAVVNGDCYWMSLHDIGDERIAYLLMGVANSSLGRHFYDAVCGNRLYAGRRRWITQYVARLPLPDPVTAPGRSLIALAAEFAGGGAEPDIALLDDRVARAFGLDPDRPDPVSWS
ncbi:Eco57I restriction-modification methylase domain-containing protein [Nocardia vermiculata]|nr:N-6 DNA methylase [Nocardia vermiculata]